MSTVSGKFLAIYHSLQSAVSRRTGAAVAARTEKITEEKSGRERKGERKKERKTRSSNGTKQDIEEVIHRRDSKKERGFSFFPLYIY